MELAPLIGPGLPTLAILAVGWVLRLFLQSWFDKTNGRLDGIEQRVSAFSERLSVVEAKQQVQQGEIDALREWRHEETEGRPLKSKGRK